LRTESYSLFDWRRGPARVYLSRGCWGRPGLAVRLSLRHFAVVIHVPYFEPADLWVGVYHREVHYADGFTAGRDFWICPLPTLVLKLQFSWARRDEGRAV